MLKNIFIPERIGTYYIFAKRIIGFQISKNYITATQVRASADKTIIEKNFTQKIELSGVTNNDERIKIAIKTILNKCEKYNAVAVAIPANIITFKEIILPFLDKQKIKLVLGSEIEQLLPYSINEAYFDFVITNQDKNEKSTTILVAIIKKDIAHKYLEPFSDFDVSIIVPDVFGIYNIYKSISEYSELSESIIIDLEFNYTNILYIQNNQLKLIRSLPTGIFQIAKSISSKLNIEINKALEILMRFGIENTEDQLVHDSIINSMSILLSDIKLTLNSFLYKKNIETLLIDPFALNGLCNYFSKNLNINCSLFSTQKLLKLKYIETNINEIPVDNIISLGVALHTINNPDFNLLKKEALTKDLKNLNKQIIASLILFIAIFSTLLIHSYTQIKKLRNEINASKKQVISTLQTTFNITDPTTLRSLPETIRTSQSKVDQAEALWFSFSPEKRISYLRYLQELSSKVDRESLGLDLKKLTFTDDAITVEGEVKDFKALRILEDELNESKLFTHVTIPQETKFNIKITLKKDLEDLEA